MGEQNYKYFMLFLFTNAAFFYYGATVIFYVLVSEVSTFAEYYVTNVLAISD